MAGSHNEDMNATQTWHRLGAGEYERNGWTISDIRSYGGMEWIVTTPEGDCLSGPFYTLREAKAQVAVEVAARPATLVESYKAGEL
jgi:hypothetical protein